MKIQDTYYPNGKLKTRTETLNGQNHGKHILYSESGKILIETFYEDGKLCGKWTEYYERGQLGEEGEYVNGDYHVYNFWTESGEQLLKNGTGKTIRKYGATQGDIYEQYFENGQFIGEKKIAGVVYGNFIPDRE